MKLMLEAVPKKILIEMNVEGLTRENVASHLQVRSDYLILNAEIQSTTKKASSAYIREKRRKGKISGPQSILHVSK